MLVAESEIFLDTLGAEAVVYKKPAAAPDWISPTGYEAGNWIKEYQASDGLSFTYAYQGAPAGGWTPDYLVLTHTGVYANAVRFDVFSFRNAGEINIDVLLDGEWVDVYEGLVDDHTPTSKTFDAGLVTAVRTKMKNADPFSGDTMKVYEIELWQSHSKILAINAIVNRRQPAGIGGAPKGNAPLAEIAVDNDSVTGIASSEIDLGKDLINLPVRIGETAQDRRITKILSMDSGMMRLEVR